MLRVFVDNGWVLQVPEVKHPNRSVRTWKFIFVSDSKWWNLIKITILWGKSIQLIEFNSITAKVTKWPHHVRLSTLSISDTNTLLLKVMNHHSWGNTCACKEKLIKTFLYLTTNHWRWYRQIKKQNAKLTCACKGYPNCEKQTDGQRSNIS